MKNIAIILAGGTGIRLGLEKPKQFLKVAGKTVLEHTVDVFQKHKGIDEIYIVMHPTYVTVAWEMVSKNHWTKVKKVLNGGDERYKSSLVAINACNDDNANLIFHDAVRPLVSGRIVDEVIVALREYGAVDVAIPSADTIIELDTQKECIAKIPNREYLNRGQTPQAFRCEIIKRAYENALKNPKFRTTDDCGIVKKYLPDEKIYVVKGEERNVKLTYPEDIYVLDKLFQLKSATVGGEIELGNLKDKVLVVFGGNSGIGSEMCRIALQNGAKVYAFSRSTTGTDITDKQSVEQTLKAVADVEKHIDYVVSTAAVLNKEPILHLDEATVDGIISINYHGMVNVTLAAYPYVKKSRGQILHFTSSSYTRGRAFYALYSSTKAAVVNFVQAVAEEWEADGVQVNCINPQRTKTPMRMVNFGEEPEETLLKAEDVAIVALKTLLSDFTGEVVDIKLN